MKKFLVIYFFLVSFCPAQIFFTDKDVHVCNSTFRFAYDRQLSQKPINEIIVEIGKSFIGKEYIASYLERGDKEQLVVTLNSFDCYTFLEASLVFARCIKRGDTTFDDYTRELENIRYRGGMLKDYPSRLHYFSDWIFEMDKRNICINVTKEIGGEPLSKKINFMSKNTSYYKQLVENPGYIEQIKIIEDMISSREYYYIPKNTIADVEDKIMSGDIIGITTNIDGLDIAHTGIAIRMDDGRIHLLHASTSGKKVQISSETLADYLKKNKKQTGIMIVRPL
ncbi:MAG: N-acetylmuramoyl-L-alanine amidase-like domain-containing protein [bacterium]